MSTVPAITLDNDVEIPQLGLGVWQIDDAIVPDAVKAAIEAGYRHIDTAAIYGNERASAQAIAASGLAARGDVRHHQAVERRPGRRRTLRAFDESLRPARPGLRRPVPDPLAGAEARTSTWTPGGRSRSCTPTGGSARSGCPTSSVRTWSGCSTRPTCARRSTRSSCTRSCQQAELRAFHAEHGIVTEAWSPLAQGDLLGEPVLVELAERHGRTPAQVVLRWHIAARQRGDPEVVDPGPDRGEHRRLRLRARTTTTWPRSPTSRTAPPSAKTRTPSAERMPPLAAECYQEAMD